MDAGGIIRLEHRTDRFVLFGICLFFVGSVCGSIAFIVRGGPCDAVHEGIAVEQDRKYNRADDRGRQKILCLRAVDQGKDQGGGIHGQ